MRVENVTAYNGPAIYVGRPSQWGNPFPVGDDRAGAISKFRDFALAKLALNPGWLDPLLDTEVITCWCAPKACHGDVLADFIENGWTINGEHRRIRRMIDIVRENDDNAG